MAALFLPVLFAFTSLTVDVGYYYQQRSRLQAVADMATVSALGNVQWDRIAWSVEQSQINTYIQNVLSGNGFAPGTFGAPTCSVFEDNVTTVTVDAMVPVQSFFSRVLGFSSVNIHVRSRAEVRYQIGGVAPAADYALYARRQVQLRSTSSQFRSFNSFTTPMVLPASPGPIWTNTADKVGSANEIYINGSGNYDATLWSHIVINTSGTPTIGGDAMAPVVNMPASAVGGSIILSEPPEVIIPVPTVPLAAACHHAGITGSAAPAAYGSDEVVGPHKTLILQPGGTYFFNSITVKVNATVTTAGATPVAGASADSPVKIFLAGDFDMCGWSTFGTNQMKIYGTNPVAGAQDIFLRGQGCCYADVVAPNADVLVQGSAESYGRIYGYTIDVQSDFIFDEGLASHGFTSISNPVVAIPVHLTM